MQLAVPRPIEIVHPSSIEAAVARNKKNIAKFPYNPSINLPLELLNEPFSFEDNRLRPEKIGTRAKFYFEIRRDMNPLCLVGTKKMYHPESPRMKYYPRPIKHTSNLSVADIYDTYGLEVTHTFLHYLYHNKFDNEYPLWLVYHLQGSLAVLKPEMLEDIGYDSSAYRVLYLCSELMFQLGQIEARQPKMIGDLAPGTITLPVELLPQILRSRLLSKDYSRTLQADICSQAPTEDELWQVRGDDYVNRIILVGNVYFNMRWDEGSDILTCERVGEDVFKFRLEFDVEEVDTTDATIVGYLLSDYKQVFNEKRCNVKQSITKLLEDLISRTQIVNESNIEQVIAWTLQLVAYDDLDLEEGEWQIEGYDNLRDELHRLCRYYIDEMLVEHIEHEDSS